jgi:uncharacterized protein YwqG
LVESVSTYENCQLCADCYSHADTFSLSPREWYNLITIHGNSDGWCHGYSDDGVATKAIRRVFDPKECELPTLQTVMGSLPRMLEYSLSPYLDDFKIFSDMRSLFSVDAITEALSVIIANKPTQHLLGTGALRVCRFALGADAATWLLSNWDQYASKVPVAFIDAAAHCLPFEQAFRLAKNLLKSHPAYYMAMSSFGSVEVLDWIEEEISSPFTPWGLLAAQSQLSWSRVEDWIQLGRPLSLVAISALKDIVSGDGTSVSLYQPVAIDYMCAVLESYQKIDTAPNVDFMISSIIRGLKKQGLGSSQPVLEEQAELIQGRLDRETNMKSLHISAFKPIKKKCFLKWRLKQSEFALMQAKLGGQPDWLDDAEWPLDSIDKQPMSFIGQVHLTPDLFPELVHDTMAYIFMMDDEMAETWDEDSGCNAVVLQSAKGKQRVHDLKVNTGPTFSEQSYVLVTKPVVEPDHISTPISEQLDSYYDDYDSFIRGNKIAGNPCFLQADQYPVSAPPEVVSWNLVLQLDSENLPFLINFDGGVGYVFLSSDGEQARFFWQR